MSQKILMNIVLMSIFVVMGVQLEAAVTTFNAVEDAEIDGHVNWREDTKGIPHPEWNWDASELRVRIYDPNEYPGAEASHVLIRWDVSAIPTGDAVVTATLEMSGWDAPDAPIEVYGITEGNWNEATVTWNSWQATTKNLTFVGYLTSAGPANSAGQTFFSTPGLTALVRQWTNGTQKNYGVLLKMSGSAPVGDSFSSREATWVHGHAPQLKVEHIPAAVPGTMTLDAIEDAEIDSHINWRNGTKGIPHPEWSHDASELRVSTYDPVSEPDPNTTATHVLIKWDVSAIHASDTVTSATLEMSGWDYSDGPIEVYGIETGDWDEATITWNNWASTTQSLVFLGHMVSAGPAAASGPTIFSNSELADWVQKWVNGSQGNYGLILIMSEDGTPGGDSFSSRDSLTYGHAPQLKITHSATNVSVTGEVAIDGYIGNLSLVAVQIEFQQESMPVIVERMLLSTDGSFAVPNVPLGEYDIIIKAYSQLREIRKGVNISLANTDVGIITLRGGDFDGTALLTERI